MVIYSERQSSINGVALQITLQITSFITCNMMGWNSNTLSLWKTRVLFAPFWGWGEVFWGCHLISWFCTLCNVITHWWPLYKVRFSPDRSTALISNKTGKHPQLNYLNYLWKLNTSSSKYACAYIKVYLLNKINRS